MYYIACLLISFVFYFLIQGEQEAHTNTSKVEELSEENVSKNHIKWTKLWSELKSFQAPWKAKDLKKFGKDFGLALFFFICCFYELILNSLVAKSFLFGNDYIRDVKNRQGTIKLPGVFKLMKCK
jgi:hypothetical protein